MDTCIIIGFSNLSVHKLNYLCWSFRIPKLDSLDSSLTWKFNKVSLVHTLGYLWILFRHLLYTEFKYCYAIIIDCSTSLMNVEQNAT